MGQTDSKILFRQSVLQLITKESISPDSTDFFQSFWSIPTSADEIFTLLPASDVKRIRDQNPDGFIHLFQAVMHKFINLAADKSWSSSQHSLMASFTGHGSSPTQMAANDFGTNASHCLLNCVRLLTKLVPFIFELSPDMTSPVCLLLNRPFSNNSLNSLDSTTTLGQTLLSTTVQLLFRPGFTVPQNNSDISSDIIDNLSWDICHSASSIALSPTITDQSSSTVPSYTEPTSTIKIPGDMIMNRIELLRLLLVCLSQSMYLPPPLISSFTSIPTFPIQEPHSQHLASSSILPSSRPTIPPLLAESNGNQMLSYITLSEDTYHLPSSWVSLLIRSLIYSIHAWTPNSGWIPYEYILPSNYAPLLAMLSTHVLCALIFSGSSFDDSNNRICHFLAALSFESAASLAKALVKLLVARRHKVLPGSTTVVWFHEVLCLIFAFIHISQELRKSVDSRELSDLLIPELLDILKEYQSEQEINLLRITFHILLSLSLKETSLASEIVKTIYTLMSQPAEHLVMFYDPLLSILRRVIYYHQIDFSSAEMLIQLACVMGQPLYLVKGENNYMLALALFDMIEFNIIHENRHTMECVMKYHRELSQFVFIQHEQLETPLVGKGKAKKQTENWSPNITWFQTWRSQVILPQLEYILTSVQGESKQLDTIATELMRFPKNPPKSVSIAALDRYTPPNSVIACLPGFVWGACFLRHKPGERSLPLFHGTLPKLFKVVHAPNVIR